MWLKITATMTTGLEKSQAVTFSPNRRQSCPHLPRGDISVQTPFRKCHLQAAK